MVLDKHRNCAPVARKAGHEVRAKAKANSMSDDRGRYWNGALEFQLDIGDIAELARELEQPVDRLFEMSTYIYNTL